ncbi:hypothetical protein ACFLRN_08000 [Thermoproteota archaeon]
MKIKNVDQIIQGWFPTEPKISINWSKNQTVIVLSVLISFSLIVIYIINSSAMVFVGTTSVLRNQNYEGFEEVGPSSREIIIALLSQKSYQLVNTDKLGNLVWNQTYTETKLTTLQNTK